MSDAQRSVDAVFQDSLNCMRTQVRVSKINYRWWWEKKLSNTRVLSTSRRIIKPIISTRDASLTVRGHELADRRRGSAAVLHERHFRHDDVVLEHGATAHTHGIAASLVHVHVRPTAILTPPHGVGVAVTSGGQRNADEGGLLKQKKRPICLEKYSWESSQK